MCFEIGNKVAVIDDIIEGFVTDVQKDIIFVKDKNGMQYQFDKKELVRLGKSQHELSKYSDINNKLLKEKQTEKSNTKSSFKKYKKEVVMEVDLHVEKLVKSTKGMDNYDILSLQLNTAKRKIEYCLQKRIPKIVFIHGVGEGVLKSELQTLLNRYTVNYYDASYRKYGLGATEVTLL